MANTNDDSGFVERCEALALIPQTSNPDAGSTSGAANLWTKTSDGSLNYKNPAGTTTAVPTNDALLVHLAGAEAITGVKTLSAAPVFAAGLTASGSVSNNFSGATGTFETPTSTANFFKFNQRTSAGATVRAITDPGNGGAIPVTSDGVCNITSAGAETRTLAVPTFVGQRLTICMDVDGGDAVITVASAFNQAGNTTITLNDAGDAVHLVGAHIAGARRWRLISNDGATLG